ncbi:MAG: molybdate ABC transporter substrate-binding protein [Nitrospirae bacterium]|nr:molybdate ABC transporter substrate-binding protein [Nitrospirota bacterium]
MKWYELMIFIALCSLFAALFMGEALAGQEITVSAALSLKAPFEEIGRKYARLNKGVGTAFNFAASGVLQKQIEAGAPTDVFAAASAKEMDALEAAGLIIPNTRANFAGNAVVLIASQDAHSRISSFKDLGKKELGRLAIGNPATVPAGKYSEEALKKMGILDMLKGKIVYAEHVRQVMDYVSRNEVDAGMVFLTDARFGGREVRIVEVAPLSSHKPVVYTIAAIKGTKNEALARNFITLLLSKTGKEILKRHGFRTET